MTPAARRVLSFSIRRGQKWRDLLEEFKGPSQAALAFLLSQGQLDVMCLDFGRPWNELNRKEVTCCNRLRRIELPGGCRLGSLAAGWRPFGLAARHLRCLCWAGRLRSRVAFRGLPTQYLTLGKHSSRAKLLGPKE